MQQGNPYYLHQENQMTVFNKQENKFQHNNLSSLNNSYQNPNRSHDEFARQNSKNTNPYQLNASQQQPSQYPPIMYQPPSFQQYQYPPLGYQPSPTYPSYPQHQELYSPMNPVPYERQSEQHQYRQNDPNRLTYDHCPFCNKMTNSLVEQRPILIAWIICFLLFFFTIVLFWLPFCFSSCKQRRFKCVNCKRVKFVIKNSC